MKEPTPQEREAWDLAQIRQRKSRLIAKPIGNVIRGLLSSTGYAETQAAALLQQQWEAAVGAELSAVSRPGNVTRGVLQVYAASSPAMQELHFRKKQILAGLTANPALSQIRELKIRVGTFERTT